MHVANAFVLLVVTRATGEWVEIAQHQPRQEPPRRSTSTQHRPTGATSIYANLSLTERPWHISGLSGNINLGSVKRVQLQSNGKDSAGVLNGSTKVKTNENRRYETLVRAPSIIIKENIGDVKRPSIDNLKQANKTNVSVYTPSRYFAPGINKIHFRNTNEYFEKTESNNFQMIKKPDKVAGLSSESHEINPVKRVHHVPSGAIDSISKVIKSDKGSHSENKTSSTSNNAFPGVETIPQNPYSPKPVVQHVVKYTIDKDMEEQNKKENGKETRDQHSDKDKSDSGSDKVVHDNTSPSGDTRTNTMEVIVTLMKVVTNNISKTTRRSFKSKVKYLEDLRNNIMANIVQQIDRAWPDDAGAAGAGGEGGRRRRAARGHVEFPSSESALMTISFLTFAVFLIKLVLQVIHTYKNKAMMVTPAVVAAVGRATRARL